MVTKELARIASANFGWGGYGDGMLGLTLDFKSGATGVGFHKGAWGIEHTAHCRWTEEERLRSLGEAVMYLGKILRDTGKERVSDLPGTPVELTLDGNMLVGWRVLTEVLR